MAKKVVSARKATVEQLKNARFDWDFLWSEYLQSRTETEAYWNDVVRMAHASISGAIGGCVPTNRSASAARAADAARIRMRDEAVPDYATILERHAALVEETCRIENTLFLLPAPDEIALLWKMDRLVDLVWACVEARQAVAADVDRLLGAKSGTA